MADDVTPERDVYDLYLRQSKGRAAIGRQRRETTDWITHKGGQVGAEFCDKDQTAYTKVGGERPDRKDFAALLAHVAAHPGRGIAAWHADRLIRGGEDTETMIRVCAAGDHLVETKGGGTYDLATATGRKRIRNDATDAAYEVDHLTERLSAMKAEHAQKGKWSGGPRPFGYEGILQEAGEPGKFRKLTIRESEARLIRAAALGVLAGASLKSVAAAWNAQGSTGAGGGEWNGRRVRRVLLRPRNAGIHVWQGSEGVTGDWPPILDVTVFRALQVMLDDPARKTGPGPERKWLGGGFCQCGICGEPVITHAAGNGRLGPGGMSRRTVYMCRGHIARSAAPVDAWIGELVCARLAAADTSRLIRPRPTTDTAAMHARIITLRENIDKLAGKNVLGIVDDRQLAAGTAEGHREISALRASIAAAAGASVLAGMPGPDGIRAWWAGLPVSRQRAIAMEQFARVAIMPAGRGRPAGSKRGEPYFDRSAIVCEWR